LLFTGIIFTAFYMLTLQTVQAGNPSIRNSKVNSYAGAEPAEVTTAIPCPAKPSLGADFAACPGGSFTLNANETTTGFTYSWYSSGALGGPYTLIKTAVGDSAITLTMGPSIVYYMAKVVSGACTATYDTIKVTPSVPNYTGSAAACGKNLTFSATGAGAYKWYTSLTGPTVAGEGATINVNASATNQSYGSSCPYSLFVQDTTAYQGILMPNLGATCSVGLNTSVTGTNAALTAIQVNQSSTINSLQFLMTGNGTLPSTASFSFVIYSNTPSTATCTSCSPTGLYDGPGTLLYTSPATSLSVTTSGYIAKTLTGSYPISAGKYWIGLVVITPTGNPNYGILACAANAFKTSTANWSTPYLDNTGFNAIEAISAIFEEKYEAAGAVYNINFTTSNPYSNSCSRLQVCADTAGTALPIASISTSANPVCSGSSTTLTASVKNGSGSYKYSWTPGADTTASITVSPSSPITYHVTITNKLSGCSSTDSVTIAVNSVPQVFVTASDSSFCLGDSTKLYANVTGNGPFTYSWSPGPGSSETLAVAPTFSNYYLVTVKDAHLCSFTNYLYINVNTPPTIAITQGADTVSTISVCSGDSLQLAASVSNGSGFYSYKWTPGAYTTDTITVYPTKPTTYIVSVLDQQVNCSTSDTVSVAVNNSPKVVVSASDTVICKGASTNLRATVAGSGSYTYNWSPGPGKSQDTTVSPNSPTTYRVLVKNSGSCTSVDSITIKVDSPPTVVITRQLNTSAAICSGDTIQLTANASGGSGSYNYNWIPGSDTTSSIIANPTSPTTYSVTVSNKQSGCGSSDTVNIAVNSTPEVVVTASDSIICLGNSTQLFASVTGGGSYSYSWSPIDSASQNPFVAPVATTTYDVIVKAANMCSSSGSIFITVDSLPKIAITASDTIVCKGGSAQLLATLTGNGSYSYSWSPGDVASRNITVSPTLSTTYSVIAKDGNLCSSTDSIFIKVDTLPLIVTIQQLGVWGAKCSGDTVQLTATASKGSGSYIYNWTPGSETSAGITITPTLPTTYKVDVTDELSGCGSTDSALVNVNPKPQVTIVQLTDTLLALASAGTPPYTYQWKGITGDTNAIIADTAGLYIVTVSDSLECIVNSSPYSFMPTILTGATSAVTATALTIYPNPASSELSISLTGSNTGNFSYTFINLNGTELLSGQGSSSISVASLPDGFYIIKAQLASGDFVYKKLIIER